MHIHLPRRICGDVRKALHREWLVTNGIGGFAAGTVAGALTRRYHGLLFAATRPPVERRLIAAKLDDTISVGGEQFQLYTNVWASGIEQPDGCRWLRRFDLRAGVPTWTFALHGTLVHKRIWMERGRNLTFVRYDIAPKAPPLTLTCRLLVNDRYYHFLSNDHRRSFNVQTDGAQLECRLPEAEPPLVARIVCARNTDWETDGSWCAGFHLPIEAARGFDHFEDHLVAGLCRLPLAGGDCVTFVLGLGDAPDAIDQGALERFESHAHDRVHEWADANEIDEKTIRSSRAQLAIAADQFIVPRRLTDDTEGHTIIAGYPWFTDWGRDAMIALPGLTLVTGRHTLARDILLTWSRFIDQGMIPNRFPDHGEKPEYHTAEAALWYLWAIDQYFRFTGDIKTLAELWPRMIDIIDWHRRGTRYDLHLVDDGLIHAGQEGVNLTWMDAKIGDRVVTPRIGKPIELSALWYDALCNMARFADVLEEPAHELTRMANQTRDSFWRFWNPHRGCCFDVIDGPNGHIGDVRPNQLFAASLSNSPLPRDQRVAIVSLCERELLAWFGVRTLAPSEPHYHGRYAGSPVERDEAYHQGTAWGWLLGPLAIAHWRLHHDLDHARQLLEPAFAGLWSGVVGNLSEIFDGDEPHEPRGGFAQAWSVAEVLRAWWTLRQAGRKTNADGNQD